MISFRCFRNGGAHNAIYQSKSKLCSIPGTGTRTIGFYDPGRTGIETGRTHSPLLQVFDVHHLFHEYIGLFYGISAKSA